MPCWLRKRAIGFAEEGNRRPHLETRVPCLSGSRISGVVHQVGQKGVISAMIKLAADHAADQNLKPVEVMRTAEIGSQTACVLTFFHAWRVCIQISRCMASGLA